MKARLRQLTPLLWVLCILGCDDIGKNEALTRGVLLVDGVGQEEYTVQIGPDMDVTDDDGEYRIEAASTGIQTVEIVAPPLSNSPMDPEVCLTLDVEIVKPITILQFNLVRETNGDISGTANTLTNLEDAEIVIAPAPPEDGCF